MTGLIGEHPLEEIEQVQSGQTYVDERMAFSIPESIVLKHENANYRGNALALPGWGLGGF
jgi:hypothetical protein